MSPADQKALIGHRMQQAQDGLVQAEALLNIKQFSGSVNRSYYAMFYAKNLLRGHNRSYRTKTSFDVTH